MALKDILVCLDASDAGENRLNLAARLAREHDAHLVGVQVLHDDDTEPLFAPLQPPVGGRFSGGVDVLERPAAEARVAPIDHAEERFRGTLRRHGIDGDWRLIERADPAEVTALAKSADLVVIGQYSRATQHEAAFRPDEIAIECGRPLLIVPYIGGFNAIGESVLIAWDGTREATRAVHDALPLLRNAKTATVMIVLSQEREFERVHAGMQRMVAHLERHGIPARAEETIRGDLSVSDLLLSRAADLGADMIVAGAYHHSPWREALIGGVSRDLLRHMTVPVLMSH